MSSHGITISGIIPVSGGIIFEDPNKVYFILFHMPYSRSLNFEVSFNTWRITSLPLAGIMTKDCPDVHLGRYVVELC